LIVYAKGFTLTQLSSLQVENIDTPSVFGILV